MTPRSSALRSQRQPQSDVLSTLVLVFHGLTGVLLLLLTIMMVFVFPRTSGNEYVAALAVLALALTHALVALGIWLHRRWGYLSAVLLDAAVAISVAFIAQSGASAISMKTAELDRAIVNFLWSLAGGYALLLLCVGVAWLIREPNPR